MSDIPYVTAQGEIESIYFDLSPSAAYEFCDKTAPNCMIIDSRNDFNTQSAAASGGSEETEDDYGDEEENVESVTSDTRSFSNYSVRHVFVTLLFIFCFK